MKNEVNLMTLRGDAKQCWDVASTIMTTASTKALSLQIDADAFGTLPTAKALADAYLGVDVRIYNLLKGAGAKYAYVAAQLRWVASHYEAYQHTNTTIVNGVGGGN